MNALITLLLLAITFLCIEFAQVTLRPIESLTGQWVLAFTLLLPLCIAGVSFLLLRPVLKARRGHVRDAGENGTPPVGGRRKRIGAAVALFVVFIVGVNLARQLAAEVTVDGRLITTRSQQTDFEKKLGFKLAVQNYPEHQKLIFLRGEGRQAKVMSALAENRPANATK